MKCRWYNNSKKRYQLQKDQILQELLLQQQRNRDNDNQEVDEIIETRNQRFNEIINSSRRDDDDNQQEDDMDTRNQPLNEIVNNIQDIILSEKSELIVDNDDNENNSIVKKAMLIIKNNQLTFQIVGTLKVFIFSEVILRAFVSDIEQVQYINTMVG